MASENLLLDVCVWLMHNDNQNHWLLVNVLICGGCQLVPERIGIMLLILPVTEEEALSSQCALRWVPKQAGSTKTSPSNGACLGEKPREASAGSPAPADGRVHFFRSSYEWRWQRGSLLRQELLSKHRETSQALCCSFRCAPAQMHIRDELDVGERVSFWLSFLGNYVRLLKL